MSQLNATAAPFMLHYLISSLTPVVYSNQKLEIRPQGLGFLFVILSPRVSKTETGQLTHVPG